ncbi:10658_t:CDS:2, partial [Dentiscutata heterogama]
LVHSFKKDEFLSQLRHTLFHIGFLYVKNHPIPEELITKIKSYSTQLFDLPTSEKLRIEMCNSPHFLGYNKLAAEKTKDIDDQREQFDFATETPYTWKEGEPMYRRLKGPNQWPDEKYVPGFKETLLEYIKRLTDFSLEFTQLIALSLGLPPDSLYKFLDPPDKHMNRLKVVKYPPLNALALSSNDGAQGVGPHKDPWITFLLQVNNVQGLQVQNHKGVWIDVPPLEGTFVVNIGLGIEAVTRGVAVATTHRVLNPPPGSIPRLSIPFFQTISYDAILEPLDVPEDIIRQAPISVVSDADVIYKERFYKNAGNAQLLNRI